eukprot:PhF_6_TR3436/c0_g1_i1/m.5005
MHGGAVAIAPLDHKVHRPGAPGHGTHQNVLSIQEGHEEEGRRRSQAKPVQCFGWHFEYWLKRKKPKQKNFAKGKVGLSWFWILFIFWKKTRKKGKRTPLRRIKQKICQFS